MSYEKKIEDLERQDLEYSIINSLNSLSHVKGIKPEKTKLSRPTQKMIDDFNEENAMYNEEEGGHPLLKMVEQVPLLDEYVAEEPPISKADMADATAEIRRLRGLILPLTQDIQAIEAERRNINEQFNRGDITAPQRIQIMENLGTDENELLDRIRLARDSITGIETDISQEKIVEKRNEDNFNDIKKKNEVKIKQYVQSTKELNRDVYFPEQQTGETEADFLERLTALQTVVQPKLSEIKAKTKIINDFNEKMTEIIKNKATINNVGASIDHEDSVENRAQLLKIFPLFKEKFLKIYGYNNNKVSVDILVEFIERMIQNSEKYVIGLAGATEEEEANKMIAVGDIIMNKQQQQRNLEVSPLTDIGILEIDVDIDGTPAQIPARVISANGQSVYFVNYRIPPRTIRLLYSLSGEKGTYSIIKGHEEDAYDSIMGKLNLDDRERDSLKLLIQNITKTTPSVISNGLFAGQGETAKNLTGWGIKQHSEKIPNSADFGKLKLNPHKLFYENILSIRYPSGFQIKGLPNMNVSPELSMILLKILKGETDMESFYKLKDDEKELMVYIIRTADLHKKIHTPLNLKQKLKDDLDIAVGEIEAGNDNPILIKKVKLLIHKLITVKAITQKEGKEYLNQLLNP